MLTNDTDESGSEAGTPTALKCINIEFMQRRIKALEDENKALQKEFRQLTKDAEKEEEKEKNLVEIISMKLGEHWTPNSLGFVIVHWVKQKIINS